MIDLPLVVAIVGTAFFVGVTDEDWKWKVLASGLLGVSLGAPAVPALHVPILVPMILQAIVAIWMAVYWQTQT